MQTKTRHSKVYFLIVFLILLVGCYTEKVQNDFSLLTPQTKDIPNSLKIYYNKHTDKEFIGSNFNVKLEEPLLIKPINSDVYYVRYHIYVAPKTTKELIVHSIKIIPNNSLNSYLNRQIPPYNGMRNEGDIFKSPTTDILLSKGTGYQALEYITFIDNNGTENMIDEGISINNFLIEMGSIQVEIKYSESTVVKNELISIDIAKGISNMNIDFVNDYPIDVIRAYQNNEVLKTYGVLN